MITQSRPVTAAPRTAASRTTAPAPTLWCPAAAQGPRRHLADATAGHVGASGRVAVAVADGVGDSHAARVAATLVADHAVRVATTEERADAAVLAAHDMLHSAGAHATGDAALIVALGPRPGDRWWTVAWVGDCRAYRRDGTELRRLTRDHTVAEHLRAHDVVAQPAMDHVLTTSVRTVRPGEIGVVTVPAPDGLLLVTDGVHRSVSTAALADLLGREGTAEARAGWIVDAATRAGTSDNATALVVDTAAAPGIVGLSVPFPR